MGSKFIRSKAQTIYLIPKVVNTIKNQSNPAKRPFRVYSKRVFPKKNFSRMHFSPKKIGLGQVNQLFFFGQKCTKENVFGKTVFYHFWEKLIHQKLVLPIQTHLRSVLTFTKCKISGMGLDSPGLEPELPPVTFAPVLRQKYTKR